MISREFQIEVHCEGEKSTPAAKEFLEEPTNILQAVPSGTACFFWISRRIRVIGSAPFSAQQNGCSIIMLLNIRGAHFFPGSQVGKSILQWQLPPQ